MRRKAFWLIVSLWNPSISTNSWEFLPYQASYRFSLGCNTCHISYYNTITCIEVMYRPFSIELLENEIVHSMQLCYHFYMQNIRSEEFIRDWKVKYEELTRYSGIDHEFSVSFPGLFLRFGQEITIQQISNPSRVVTITVQDMPLPAIVKSTDGDYYCLDATYKNVAYIIRDIG